MPVSVPTIDEFNNLQNAVLDTDADVADLKQQMAKLEARVEALEADQRPERPPGRPSTGPLPPGRPERPEPEPPDLGTMQAIVSIGLETFAFNESSSDDAGDYSDPEGRFVMTCRVSTDPDFPNFRVYFRRIEGWASIVCELGDVWVKPGKHLGAYSVAITTDDGEVVTVEVPEHWWFARWRWQSGPWPHMRPLRDMIGEGWVPEFDPACNTGAQNPMPIPGYSPMGTAGIFPQMQATGGRADIGWCTAWQGEALCTDSDQAWTNVLAQGEGINSFPLIYRDTKTGAVIDAIVEYPMATFYGHASADPQLQAGPGRASCEITYRGPPGGVIPIAAQGHPVETNDGAGNYFWSYPDMPGITIPDEGEITLAGTQGSGNSPAQGPLLGLPAGFSADMVPGSWAGACPLSLDTAHMPDAAWLAFLRTGDPYFLEALQAQVIEAFTETPRSYPQCGRQDQGRAVAWSLRTTTKAWRHTPAQTPPWCLSRDVMKAAVDQCLERIEQMLAEDNELRTVFNLPDFGLTMTAEPPQGSCAGPWQADFAIGVAAWAAVADPRFADYAAYCVKHAIARLDNQSGWPGGSPEAYSIVYRVNDAYLKSWREAYEATAPYYGIPDEPAIVFDSPAALDYPQYLYAALAMVEQARLDHGLALPNVAALRDKVLYALQDAYERMPGTYLAWNWCVA